MKPFSEQILFKLSKKDAGASVSAYQEEWDEASALSLLKRAYPDFSSLVKGKTVCDFGCGAGFQVAAVAKNGAHRVIGIEYNQKRLEFAKNLCAQLGVADRSEFFEKAEERLKGACDLVISQNSMEHFPDPAAALSTMKGLLAPGGKILITFGPPWFAPYGSHMQFFTNMPWVNILFSERTVMNVRKNFRNDGAARYEEVESGLNKMTVAKFERLIRESGLVMTYKKYECIKGLDFLAGIPCARELFVNHISCVLERVA